MNDEALTELASRASELADEVGKLRIATDSLTRRTLRSEKVIAITVVGLVLDIMLSLAVMWAYHVQAEQSDQLAANQEQARKVRDDALCPLFSLILGTYDPTTRPPAARKSYEDAYNQMHTIYTNLACTTPIIPPRTDQPAPP